jgi:hypothetical protein
VTRSISKTEIEDRQAGARLWQSMTKMTIDFDAASERWRVIGLDGAVLASFETDAAASRWAQGRTI